MEKKKYEVVIADVEMAILSDEREDFVMRQTHSQSGSPDWPV